MEKFISILGSITVFYILGTMLGSLMSLGAIYAGICALERWLSGAGTFAEVTFPFLILGIAFLIVLIGAIIGLASLFFKR